MMLVNAYAVETALGRELKFIHEIVVHQVGALRVEQRRVDVDPDRRVLVSKIIWELGVGHQVEPEQLHWRSPISQSIVSLSNALPRLGSSADWDDAVRRRELSTNRRTLGLVHRRFAPLMLVATRDFGEFVQSRMSDD